MDTHNQNVVFEIFMRYEIKKKKMRNEIFIFAIKKFSFPLYLVYNL